MPFIPRQVEPGKHYAVYTEAGKEKVKTKAAVLKEALGIAAKEDEHIEWIDFIPAKFTLQLHGWFDPEDWKNLNEIVSFIKKCLKEKKDPAREMEKAGKGKWHYDLRIQKMTSAVWFGLCVDEQTEILTENGWKFFSQLSVDDRVATLGKNWSIIFKKPKAIIKRSWDGALVSVKSQNIDMVVTPEHKCYFQKEGKQFKLFPAIEIYQSNGYFSRKVNWKGSPQILGKRPLTAELAELAGFYLAEGSCDSHSSFVLTQKTQKDYLRELLKKNGLQWKELKCQDAECINFRVFDQDLSREFTTWGNALNKRCPSAIKNAPPEILKRFLQGFAKGNGHFRVGKDWRLFTSSKQLADDLQEIAMKAGFVSNIRIRKDPLGSSSSVRTKYQVYLDIGTKKYKEYAFVSRNSWSLIDYKGFVFDVAMDENTVCLIRRSGIYHWTGRTPFRAPWTGTAENKVMGCSDNQTEILTLDGWKFFSDLKETDLVAQVNPKNLQLTFVRPKKIVSFDYKGELLGVEQQYANFLVTPGHRLFFGPRDWTKTGRSGYERRWNKLSEKKFRIISCAQAYGQVGYLNRRIEWRGKKVDRKWLEFLGFWFAEGSVYADPKSNYYLTLYQKTRVNYVNKLLNTVFPGTHIEKFIRKDGVHVWKIYKKELVPEFLKYRVGGKDQRDRKLIPKEVFEADREGIRAFLKGFAMGDGRGKMGHDLSLMTAFKPLADQLQILCILGGYSSSISRKKSGKGSDIFLVSLSDKKGLEPKVSSNHWVTKLYEGKVYSVEVPKGLVLTRRNGVYLVTGNTVKGYQTIAPGGKKLEKFLMERAEKEMAAKGIAERRDRLEWMKIKAQWFPIDSPGNPQKNQPAAMIAIEFYKPAVLHRRSLDFIDCTFLGDYLRGRYYNRLVERKMNEDELMEWQKEAIKKGEAKAFYNLSFYFWKAKDQFDLKEMLQIALGKKTKERIPAPQEKSTKAGKEKEPPSATEVFH